MTLFKRPLLTVYITNRKGCEKNDLQCWLKGTITPCFEYKAKRIAQLSPTKKAQLIKALQFLIARLKDDEY